MEAMAKLGFFIRSLHLQLKEFHQEQSANFQKASIVYRGQWLSQQDFQSLVHLKGRLLSLNNFLSTSKKKGVATAFVDGALKRHQDTVGVIFIMTIDPSKIPTLITSFAMIDEHSSLPQEQEILFTMHTVFRIIEIKEKTKNDSLWEVQLTITDESDPQLAGLTHCMKEEIDGGGWYRMGYFDQAEELYNELLENSSDDSERANVYNLLGWGKKDHGQYNEALSFYEKSLEIYQKALPDDHLNLGTMCNNIGQVYYMMGDYSKALEFYGTSLKIREKALPSTHLDLADTYLDFSACYEKLGVYETALKTLQNAYKIQQETFDEGNPAFSFTYSWYKRVYRGLKEYSKALDYFEKFLAIDRKTLPEKHPDFGLTYSNIGDIHRVMGDYEKALAFHHKALNIQETVKM
ncbi:unnamed protein product [Rotaria magnacalcarata]|uniref:Tetratricopeptide repeat protein n=1 Tax=Rotaria magnacalcarata TaxID=392030 RepID=A0A815PUA5_9BILA|nr:unnamed protein product [Rotaria magnacalcarata]CAF2195443.1 unnamed protein product [Rotaria magnacalcarata]CAF3986112.1 unnamed protein product [Rotaria magnacalcarata]CAF4120965.1 unnamed protein product [Rotaria magnacalcarata]